ALRSGFVGVFSFSPVFAAFNSCLAEVKRPPKGFQKALLVRGDDGGAEAVGGISGTGEEGGGPDESAVMADGELMGLGGALWGRTGVLKSSSEL
ncbi:hypothetical protein M1146_07380, partial [Patescibacteria group bacterium]|nr:hypothetical protein [Patescibacteria group bacterium]